MLQTALQNPTYAIGEYLFEAWEVLHAQEVITTLRSKCGLDFVGPTNLTKNHTHRDLPTELAQAYQNSTPVAEQQQYLDLFFNFGFRRDV